MNILVVEDDIYIGNLIEELLHDKYKVARAYSGTEAILQFERTHFDLVLLDLMLPGLSGEEVLQKIKNQTKVIILSAKASKNDRINNLLSGANDFIAKPFDNDELLARIEVQLRDTSSVCVDVFSYNEIVVDTKKVLATVNGHDLKLTKLEFGILAFLIKNPNKVYSKEQIFENVWNYDSFGTEDSVKVHISSIRNKIAAFSNTKYIETIWGIGFKFVKE